MQRYFLRPFPTELRRQVVANCATVIGRCRAHGVPVAYTSQPGRMTVEDRGLLVDFWGRGMVSEPADQQIVDELRPAAGDWRLEKWRYSAFVRSDLHERLQRDGRDQLVICGVYAHVGVLMTAVDAFSHDIQPFVVADAIADFSAGYHRLAIDYTAERCGVVTVAGDVLR
jgi:trans-2,3-dihydro-3-hydroxyanthranilic acid synthase